MKSLLWPLGPPPTASAAPWTGDLGVDVLARALDSDGRLGGAALKLLIALPTDLATIQARQAIIADLLDTPALQTSLAAQLSNLASLGNSAHARRRPDESALLAAAQRLGELELYIGTVEALRAALHGGAPRSEGLLTLRAELDTLAADPTFARLAAELPTLRQPLERLASVTVGINLDAELRPVGATLVAINGFRFAGQQSLLGRLLGQEGSTDLTPLRVADSQEQPFAAPLFRDLARLVDDVAKALAAGLARYARLAVGEVGRLAGELAFVLGAARLVARLQAARLPITFPELLPLDARHTELEGLYDVSLALRLLDAGQPAPLTLNDARLDDGGRVALLTGPNRGGKTTFTRAVGLAHVMAQAGLPIGARHARLSPADALWTQFASGESATVGLGRFDEEARQLAALFDHATPRSLVLLNEPLSGTSPAEALAVARGVIHGLQGLGARAIIVTHLHALAEEAPLLSAAVPGAPVVSLVASPDEGAASDGALGRSFRVRPGPPSGESRALEIARQHGLAPDQVTARLRARGLL